MKLGTAGLDELSGNLPDLAPAASSHHKKSASPPQFKTAVFIPPASGNSYNNDGSGVGVKPVTVISDSDKLSRSRETSIFTDKTAVAASDGFSNGKPTKNNGFVDRMPSNGLMNGLADFRENGGRRRSSRNKRNI